MKTKSIQTLGIAVMFACCLVIGCDKDGGSGGGASLPDADTPKQLLSNMADIFADGRTDDVDSLIAPKAEGREELVGLLKSLVGAMSKMTKLEEAAIAKYGDEAKELSKGDGPTSDMPFKDLKAKIDKAEIKEDGDKASATLEGEDDPIKMVKADGAWYLDATDIQKEMSGEGGPGIELVKKMMGAMEQLADAGMKLIDENEKFADFKTAMDKKGEEIMAPIMAELLGAAFQELGKQGQPDNN